MGSRLCERLVGEGHEIKSGQDLAIVEAMKMENVLRAERDGKVLKVLAAVGAVFEVKPLWDWSDIFFGLMVLPNVIGLVGLRRVVREMSRS